MSAQPRILVVDDEERFVANMVKILSLRGMTPKTAFNGEAALDVISREPIDVVLLDLKMPGISGKETLERAMELEDPPVVVMVTGHASVQEATELLALGAHDYLLKPCRTETLMEAVMGAFEQKRLQRDGVR